MTALLQRAEHHVFAKAVRDRAGAIASATAIVSLWLAVAMAIYRDIDLSIYTELPAAIRRLMGIPDGADAATLAYNVMLEFAAPVTLSGVAISIGAGSIAGEERQGTLRLLLAAGIGRGAILAAKLAALVVLVAGACSALWVATELVPLGLGVDIGAAHLAAITLHLGVTACMFGIMALAVGAATGNRALASSVTGGVLAVSYVAVGILPLVDGLAGLERVVPWYYFVGSDPLVNGPDWAHIGVLTMASALFAGAAFRGFERRDVLQRRSTASMPAWLHGTIATGPTGGGWPGSVPVSSIWRRATTERLGLVLVTSAVMFGVMGLLMGPMYRAVEDEIAGTVESFPDAVLALAGSGDLSTPEGWFTVETFSLVAPIAVMVVAIGAGARALAGEEADGTMSLLMANPIPRSRIVIEKAAAIVVQASVIGGSTFAGVSGANLLTGLDMRYRGIAAAAVMVTLLGLVFGALALAVGAATGRVRTAVVVATGMALTSHLLNSFLPLSASAERWAQATPHHWLLAGDPLDRGLSVGHAAVLGVLILGLVGLAVWAFDRRDLRAG